jgi:hypothetical protein
MKQYNEDFETIENDDTWPDSWQPLYPPIQSDTELSIQPERVQVIVNQDHFTNDYNNPISYQDTVMDTVDNSVMPSVIMSPPHFRSSASDSTY